MKPPNDLPTHPKLKRLVLGLVALRGAWLLGAAFLPRALPGLWRQSDTLGVSLRYWLRLTAEAWPQPWTKIFLPAVLQAGDAGP